MRNALKHLHLAHAWWWNKDGKYRIAWLTAPQAGVLLLLFNLYHPFGASSNNQIPWASSSQEITDCDRLAAATGDFDRPAGVPGIELSKDINAAAAVPACEAEVKRSPSNRRYWANLGRAYRAEKKDTAAAEAYKKAAELGSTFASYAYGAMLSKGIGVQRDLVQGRLLLEKAAEAGFVPAMSALGYMLVDGLGGPTDYKGAARWFNKAAPHYAAAQFGLAKLYETGRGVVQNYSEAVRLFQSAAGQQFVDAYIALGNLYEGGLGVPSDYVQAFKWYAKAAEVGKVEGQFKLGVYYNEGRGVTADHQLAAKWFRAAAEQGATTAQANLGRMYAAGVGVEQDYLEAGKWLLRAAEHNDGSARSDVGHMYETGKGFAQSYDEAVRWYKLGADVGTPSAEFGLARLYNSGHGLPLNYIEAAKWYQRAADRGFEKAEYNLALMYMRGQGVSRDLTQAYKLATLALRSSDKEVQDVAIKLRRELALSMTPDLISKAERAAAEWHPTDPGPPPKILTQSVSVQMPASDPIQVPTDPVSRQASVQATAFPVPRPSFDCSLAKFAVEHMICADRDLASADAELGEAYQKRLRSMVPIRQKLLAQEEADWVAWRNAQCKVQSAAGWTADDLNNSKVCLLRVIRARTQALAVETSKSSTSSQVIDVSIPFATSGRVRHPTGQAALKISADPSSTTIAMFGNGAPLLITQNAAQWYRVRIGNAEGFMHHSWVKVDQFESGRFEERRIQVISFQDYSQAESYVRSSAQPLTIQLATNGWFAVTLDGSFDKATADQILSDLKANDSVPADSFITYGNTYVRTLCCRLPN
jgi:TPR repeat protein/uncharacterized protein